MWFTLKYKKKNRTTWLDDNFIKSDFYTIKKIHMYFLKN